MVKIWRGPVCIYGLIWMLTCFFYSSRSVLHVVKFLYTINKETMFSVLMSLAINLATVLIFVKIIEELNNSEMVILSRLSKAGYRLLILKNMTYIGIMITLLSLSISYLYFYEININLLVGYLLQLSMNIGLGVIVFTLRKLKNIFFIAFLIITVLKTLMM